MIVVPQNIEFIETEGLNGGLNGKFGDWIRRHRKGLIGVLGALASGNIIAIGAAIVGIILEPRLYVSPEKFKNVNAEGFLISPLDIPESGAKARISKPFEPTASESAILEPWITKKLNPYFVSLLKELDSALKSSNFNVQIEAINTTLLKICYIKQYYATRELSGLSTDAVEGRLQLISAYFEPVQILIDDIVSKHPTELKLVTNTTPISEVNWRDLLKILPSLVPGQVLTCQKYVVVNSSNVSTPNAEKNNEDNSNLWLWGGASLVTIVLVALSFKKQSKK